LQEALLAKDPFSFISELPFALRHVDVEVGPLAEKLYSILAAYPRDPLLDVALCVLRPQDWLDRIPLASGVLPLVRWTRRPHERIAIHHTFGVCEDEQARLEQEKRAKKQEDDHSARPAAQALAAPSRPFGRNDTVLSGIEFNVETTRVRHATTIAGLITMIYNSVDVIPTSLAIEGRFAKEQYTGVKLAWFGIDLTSVGSPALEQFLQPDREDRYHRARDRANKNRYGCVVLSFPLKHLLQKHPHLHFLGVRKYWFEVSQTVIADSQERTWFCEKEDGSISKLRAVRVDDRGQLPWPVSICYDTSGHWTHPEFAGSDRVSIGVDDGLRIEFVPHGYSNCVKKKSGSCDCARAIGRYISPDQAQELFVDEIRRRPRDLTFDQAVAGVRVFQKNYKAFNAELWDALTTKMPELSLEQAASSSSSSSSSDLKRKRDEERPQE
jgi:hypothetical protein